MGKLNHEPYITHFSHPHPLELTNTQHSLTPTQPCSACKQYSTGWMYMCKEPQCIFTIHLPCTQMPSLITHPSHPAHPLTLHTATSYHGGVFKCDGCGHRGQGFSYQCSACDFDLHMMCATKPMVVAHGSHPHQLGLFFQNPYQSKGFSCDLCRKVGINQWLYRCGPCGFDAHVQCASPPPMVQPQQPQQPQQAHVLQHSNSYPGINTIFNGFNRPVQPLLHSQSLGVPLPNYQMMPTQQNVLLQNYQMMPIQQNVQLQSYQMMPIQQNVPVRQNVAVRQNNAPGPGNALLNIAVQGFVQGAAEQVGQCLVQGIMGDDNGAGAADGNSYDAGAGGGGDGNSYDAAADGGGGDW